LTPKWHCIKIVQIAGEASVISSDAIHNHQRFRAAISGLQREPHGGVAHVLLAARIRDLTQSNAMKLTQESLGHMLGVRRTSVTLLLARCKGLASFDRERGVIEISDAEAMEKATGECYASVRSHYERLLS
jgi:Crp-like helix-turn-helix domain